MFRRYVAPGDLASTIPVFPLGGALLLPRGTLPLNIFEPRYISMIDDAMRGNRLIGMIQPRTAERLGHPPTLYDIGCVGRITSYSETEDARFLITLTGLCRFHIVRERSVDTPYRQVDARYDLFAEDLVAPEAPLAEDERQRLLDVLKEYLTQQQMRADWDSIHNAGAEQLVNALAMICPFEANEKQALLEAPTLAERAQILIALISMARPETPSDDESGTLQ